MVPTTSMPKTKNTEGMARNSAVSTRCPAGEQPRRSEGTWAINKLSRPPVSLVLARRWHPPSVRLISRGQDSTPRRAFKPRVRSGRPKVGIITASNCKYLQVLVDCRAPSALEICGNPLAAVSPLFLSSLQDTEKTTCPAALAIQLLHSSTYGDDCGLVGNFGSGVGIELSVQQRDPRRTNGQGNSLACLFAPNGLRSKTGDVRPFDSILAFRAATMAGEVLQIT
jgi:hypothetical protein